MPQVAAGLADPVKAVRESAASALASYGEASLSLAGTYLNSPRPEVVDATISAIGQVGTRRAEDMLYEFMKGNFRQIADNLRWLSPGKTTGGRCRLRLKTATSESAAGSCTCCLRSARRER
jgi:HEAT repeat protein